MLGSARFSVGVYHMPCIFRELDVMCMHAALLVECLDDFAGGDLSLIHI